MLGIYAEGFNPRDFGFDYTDKQLKIISNRMRFDENKMFSPLRYQPIQNTMKQNLDKKDLPKEIKWFYNVDLKSVGKAALWLTALRKIKYIIIRLKSLLIKITGE